MEAKNLAIRLRILFHDTSKSKSLLGQLNRLRTKFLDTALDWNSDSILTHGGLVYIASGPPPARYVAMLDDIPNSVKKEVDFEDWWNKPVFVDKQQRQLSRKKLILTATDQDGGAHVDPALEESYYALSRENSLNWKANDGYGENPIEGPEKAAIRQMAHETLKTLVPGYEKQPLNSSQVIFGGVSVREVSAEEKSLPTHVTKKEKTGRNEPCPCGSGKKYKKCCLDKNNGREVRKHR